MVYQRIMASSIFRFDGFCSESYIISRYVEFAFLAAVNEKADPVDQMSTYVTTINKELYRKRQEFDMKVLADGETPPGYRIDD